MADKKDDKPERDDAAKAADQAKSVEDEQGFRGLEVDPTPNENYTVAGVLAGKPTPETDDAAAEAARKAQADVARKATGVAGK